MAEYTQIPDHRKMPACVTIGGAPLVHPPGHPHAGEVVEFPLRVPGRYELTIGVDDDAPSWCWWMRFRVEVHEDGRYRIDLVDQHLPAEYDPVRKFLDVVAALMARDVLEGHR